MVISVEMDLLDLLAKMIEVNRSREADAKYIEFLVGVYAAAYGDPDFANHLESLLELSGYGPFPSLQRVEQTLAKMDGGIRPLLEEKGIVEARR